MNLINNSIKEYLPRELIHNSSNWENIHDLLDPWKIAYQTLVVDTLIPFINKLNNKIFAEENRVAFQILPDNKNNIKSCKSIKSKIIRWLNELNNDKELKVPNQVIKRKKNLKNMIKKEFFEFMFNNMEDIARCRILCNYESDVENIKNKIQEEYKANKSIRLINCKDNRIEGGKRFYKGGHRAIHLKFKVKVGELYPFVEIQLMTFLQNAWDMKEHALYELKRNAKSKKNNNKELEITQDKFHAFSGLLKIADEFIDVVWKEYKRKLYD